MLSDSEEDKTMHDIYLECIDNVKYIEYANDRLEMLKGNVDFTQEDIELTILNLFLEANHV
jgi:hypothetical protein